MFVFNLKVMSRSDAGRTLVHKLSATGTLHVFHCDTQ